MAWHGLGVMLIGRFEVHACSATDDYSGRAAVPQHPQDVQQYPAVSARVNTHQRLVHRRRIRSPRQYTRHTYNKQVSK